jgi:hypothetical protein
MERTDALKVWTLDVRRRLGAVTSADLRPAVERVSIALGLIEQYGARAARSDREFQQAGARAFSYAVARIEAAILLIEYAVAAGDEAGSVAAKRWSARPLASFVEGDSDYRRGSARLTGLDDQA